MKPININIYLLLAVFLALGGCAVTDVDRSVDMNRYKTFGWGSAEIKTENPVYNSDLINKNIKATIKNEFERRGIALAQKNPDVLVSFKTYTEKKQETSGGPFYGGYPYYPLRFYPYGFGWGWGFPYGWGTPPRTETHTEGTLIVDIVDRKTDEVVWRGTVSGNVDNVARLQKQIQKGIKAIMKKYPVPATDSLEIKNDVVS